MKKITSALLLIFLVCLNTMTVHAGNRVPETADQPLVWNSMDPINETTDQTQISDQEQAQGETPILKIDKPKPANQKTEFKWTPEQKASNDKKITTDNVTQNTLGVSDAISKQADFIYTYKPNSVFKVYCTPERIVDVQLQPGEEIVYIGGADTVRWIIDKDISGTGATKQYHIFIKPEKLDITTGLIITTDKHVYHLDLYAQDFCTPIINWAYPVEEKMAFMRKQEEERQHADNSIPLGTANMSLENLNFKYEISGGTLFWSTVSWKPVLVFDDGLKTYIQMPTSIKASEAPALFIKEGKDLAVVNYRIKDYNNNKYYVVDRLADAFEMRVGKGVVRIIKQANR